jgi:hypothetical protein
MLVGGRGGSSVVGSGTVLQYARPRVRFSIMLLDLFYLHILSGRTIHSGWTKPLTEMSTMNFSGGNWRPARNANVSTINESIIWINAGASMFRNPVNLHGLLQG